LPALFAGPFTNDPRARDALRVLGWSRSASRRLGQPYIFTTFDNPMSTKECTDLLTASNEVPGTFFLQDQTLTVPLYFLYPRMTIKPPLPKPFRGFWTDLILPGDPYKV